MFNTMLNNKFVLIPLSISLLYTFYNVKEQLNELKNIKHQIRKLSKKLVQLENAQKNKTVIMTDMSSNTDEIINESSDKLVIDTKLANSTSTNDNTSTKNIEEIHDYEFIDSKNDIGKCSGIVNRKKSNSISETIWNGLTDNIIFF